MCTEADDEWREHGQLACVIDESERAEEEALVAYKDAASVHIDLCTCECDTCE